MSYTSRVVECMDFDGMSEQDAIAFVRREREEAEKLSAYREAQDEGERCQADGCTEEIDIAYGKYCAGCGPHMEVYELTQRGES